MTLEFYDLGVLGKNGKTMVFSLGSDFIFGDFELYNLFSLFFRLSTPEYDRVKLFGDRLFFAHDGVIFDSKIVADEDWSIAFLTAIHFRFGSYFVVAYRVKISYLTLVCDKYDMRFLGSIFNGKVTYASRELANFRMMYKDIDLSCGRSI